MSAAIAWPTSVQAAHARSARNTNGPAPTSWQYEAIEDALDDPVVATQVEALKWLAAHPHGEKGPPISDELLAGMRRWLAPTASAQDKRTALEAVAAMGEAAGRLASDVGPLLDDPSADVRIAAIRAIVRLKWDGAAYLDKVTALLDSEDRDVRQAAIEATGSMDQPPSQIVQAHLRDLNDRDPEVRAAALSALALVGRHDAALAPEIAAHLRDRIPSVRIAALEALGQIGPGAAHFAGDIATYLRHAEAGTRAAASKALGQMGARGGAYAPQIARLLDDPSEEVVDAAYEALASLGEHAASAAPRVARDLDAAHAVDRIRAIETLAAMGPAGAAFADRIRDAAEHGSLAERGAAERALEELGLQQAPAAPAASQSAAVDPSSAPAPRAEAAALGRLAVITTSSASGARAALDALISDFGRLGPFRSATLRIRCLDLSLRAPFEAAQARLACHLLGPMTGAERTLFAWTAGAESDVPKAAGEITDDERALGTFKALWSLWPSADTRASDGGAAATPLARQRLAKALQRIATSRPRAFGKDTALLEEAVTRVRAATLIPEAAALQEVVDANAPWFEKNKAAFPITLAGALLMIANLAAFALSRYSSSAWAIATDTAWGSVALRIGTLVLSFARRAQLWILDFFCRTMQRAAAASTRVPYFAVPLTPAKGGAPCASLDVLKPPWTGRRTWIRGGSGMGKSALVDAVLAGYWQEPGTAFQRFARWQCVLVEFAAREFVDASEDKADPEWVVRAVQAKLAHGQLKFKDVDLLERMLRKGTIGVVIDGLNEAGKPRAVDSFAKTYGAVPMLVTSQDPALPGFDEWLLPKDIRDTTHQLLQVYLDSSKVDALYAHIVNTGLRDELRSGYDVRLIVDLARADPSGATLPHTLASLYAAVVQAAWPSAPSPQEAAEQQSRLAAAAWKMVCQRGPAEDTRRLHPEVDLAGNLLAALAGAQDRDGRPIRLIRRAGGGDYEFVHDRMHAYLAARWFAQPGRSIPEMQSLLDTATIWSRHRSEQETLWSFVAALIDDVDTLAALLQFVDEAVERAVLRVALKRKLTRRGVADTTAFPQIHGDA